MVKLDQDFKVTRKELWELVTEAIKPKEDSLINYSVVTSKSKGNKRANITNRSRMPAHK